MVIRKLYLECFQNFLWSENLQETSNEVFGRGPSNSPKLLPGSELILLLKTKTPFSWLAWKPHSSKVEVIVKPSAVRSALQSERYASFYQVHYRSNNCIFINILSFRYSWLMSSFFLFNLFLIATDSCCRKRQLHAIWVASNLNVLRGTGLDMVAKIYEVISKTFWTHQ